MAAPLPHGRGSEREGPVAHAPGSSGSCYGPFRAGAAGGNIVGMTDAPQNPHADLAAKIGRLVQEKGWNQEDFAKAARINRHTVRQILQPTGNRRLRNATVASCAKALGLSVNDLHTLPVERLLRRVQQPPAALNGDDALRRLFEQPLEPELRAWLERNPERGRRLTPDEVEQLLSWQGEGGPLGTIGVENLISQLEQKRKLLHQVEVIAQTEYRGLLEQLVGLIYAKVHPPGDEAG